MTAASHHVLIVVVIIIIIQLQATAREQQRAIGLTSSNGQPLFALLCSTMEKG